MKELSVSLLVFFCVTSCCTIQKTTFNEKKNDTHEMIMKGFLEAKISLSNKDCDCPVTLVVKGKNGTYYLDPINLDEKYHMDGLSVWIKYNGLRRMNRCQKANPITINEIVTD